MDTYRSICVINQCLRRYQNHLPVSTIRIPKFTPCTVTLHLDESGGTLSCDLCVSLPSRTELLMKSSGWLLKALPSVVAGSPNVAACTTVLCSFTSQRVRTLPAERDVGCFCNFGRHKKCHDRHCGYSQKILFHTCLLQV